MNGSFRTGGEDIGLVKYISVVVLGWEVKIFGLHEDIWVVVLGWEVRISGPGEDIRVAVLGSGGNWLRISWLGEDI